MDLLSLKLIFITEVDILQLIDTINVGKLPLDTDNCLHQQEQDKKEEM